MQNLQQLLERLLEHKIDFVLVGGFAGVVHGATLVTQDLDICMAITESEIAKLRAALDDLHAVHRMNPNFQPSFKDQPKDLSGVNNIYLKTDLGILDVISQVEPVGDFARVKNKAFEISLYGHKCKVISLDDLVQVKESMQRPKDKALLQELKTIKSASKA
jgi:predicted nucleotidyltransferase